MAASSGAEAGKAAATGPPGPVSFGFSRKAERRRVLAAGPCAEPGVGGEGSGGDTDFLTAVEDRELLSVRPAPPPPKELIIPLIPSHRWRNPEPPPAPGEPGHAPSPSPAPDADHAPSPDSAPSGDPPMSVEAQAVQELIQEARQSQEQGEGPPGPPISIPLQLGDRDDAPRPQPGPQDYEAVPVEAFGLAMLRGMGWSQGEGIGRTFKRLRGLDPETARAVGSEGAPGGAPPPHWLRRDLRVRCVARDFRAGRYYNCKLVVEDLLSPDTCVCRTDEGQLVEGLKEAMLETVIPRGDADRVMVVLGPHAGKVGRILEREPGRSRALVQLEGTTGAGRVLELDYDAVCHYLGGDEDD
ncbi:LOW QUALITY PROTEIN: G-patch domain and KOW motifs-containing protein-like [Numenius arquata]|uniref:LOW QUALITY PROTEIN: G-patch domain and KOW motifs-containing protein-like n=1 Tax=Numenius arquata TaxID=31919 RepID=UPI003D305B7C